MNDRVQFRPKIRKIIVRGAAFAVAAAAFGFLMLLLGSVPPAMVWSVTVAFVVMSGSACVAGLFLGRRWGYNSDVDTGKALGGFMASPLGFVAVVLAPVMGLLVAARAGDVGRALLPMAVSAMFWFMVGAGTGNLRWVKDGESVRANPGPDTDDGSPSR